MAKFVIGLEEAIVALHKHFGLPQSVQVEIEFDKTAPVKSDDDWHEVPKDWILGSPPGELDYNDHVEVILHDGTKFTDRAGPLGIQWRQDCNNLDIVKYRRA